jgi:uncharacterized membrane protein YdjX (TVP38/TMEM64 family)
VFWGGGVVLGVLVAALVVNRGDLRAAADVVVAWLQAAGPLVFFVGMGVLPVVGFPLLPFSLVAGPVFGPMLGVPAVVACAVAAVLANVTLSYALASRWLHPPILRLIDRLGYRLPVLPNDSTWQVVWIVRLTPGLPFWTQSYVLGLMRVPFGPYLVVSTLLPAGYITGTIIFGDALFKGHMKLALLGFAILGFCAVGVRLWRKRRAVRLVTPKAGAAERDPVASGR